MAAPTQQFNSSKGDFASTIRHTINMISGKDVANYSLLFMDPTEKHPAGSHETIFNPSIILGRGGNCQIKYDDRYKTVSREHACIGASNGSHIIFHNPSAKNPTLVNGVPVADSQPLKNGDEIKLSNDGPRLRYNTSQVKSSTMGFTSRMGVALSQATKPYKRAMITMFIGLLGALGFSGYTAYKGIALKEKSDQNEMMVQTLQSEKNRQQNALDKLESSGSKNVAEIRRLKKGIKEAEDKIKDMEENPTVIVQKPTQPANSNASGGSTPAINNGLASPSAMTGGTNTPFSPTNPVLTSGRMTADDIPYDDIYYIYAQKLEYTLDGQLFVIDARTKENDRAGIFGGTGFLTDDGKFITARHVIQPWRYPDNGLFDDISALEARGNKVLIRFEALSKTGDKFTFTSDDAIIDDSKDEAVTRELNFMGMTVTEKTKMRAELASDWAFIKYNYRKGSISLNAPLSKSLKAGSKLFAVGYSYTEALQPQSKDLSPLLSSTDVAQTGLINGNINTTNRNFGPGNSGGPVFAFHNGKYYAVGIVSHGLGSEIGILVPIINMR